MRSVITGDKLKDLPKGLPRRYDGIPREVKVDLQTWVGTSAIGAIHYYLTFREEPDYFICNCKASNDVHYHEPWDDKRRGDEWRMGFPSQYDAMMSFRSICKMMEGSPKYKLVWDEERMTEYEDEAIEEQTRQLGLGNRNWVRDTYDRD